MEAVKPKEKAEQLISEFAEILATSNGSGAGAIECALLMVDEILKLPSSDEGRMIVVLKSDYTWWKEVKLEIEKLC